MDDLLKQLREETSDLHRDLDQRVSVDDPTSCRDAYARYLTGFHAALVHCWPMLDWARMKALGLPEPTRRKQRYDALGVDLEGLGISVPALPDRDASPIPEGASVGCLYVLEGSIHGGGQLLSHLTQKTPDFAGANLRFLRGFGEDNASTWREFVSWLKSLELPHGFVSEARGGAATAFRHFIASFDSTPCNPSTPE